MTSSGAALGFAFVSLVGLVMWWMLNPTTQFDVAVRRAMHGVSAIRRILVPVRGRAAYNERAVELACRLGEEQRAQIVLTHVIVVPLSQPLGSGPATLPEIDQVLGRAQEIVRHHGLRAETATVRERNVARGILRAARDHKVDLVVLGINPKILRAGESVGRATEQLLRKSQIEVIVDMHPTEVTDETARA
jgi:nucleotide-binding universal stress UspA family protein